MELQQPLPEFVAIVQEARYWGVSPMEIMEWPIEWVTNGQIVREAENKAQELASKR